MYILQYQLFYFEWNWWLINIVLIQINYANDLIKNAYELNFVYIFNICFIHKNIFICL